MFGNVLQRSGGMEITITLTEAEFAEVLAGKRVAFGVDAPPNHKPPFRVTGLALEATAGDAASGDAPVEKKTRSAK